MSHTPAQSLDLYPRADDSGAQFRPATKRDNRPNRLDEAEGPSALQEAVGRAERASPGEPKHEPRTAILWGIIDEHCRNAAPRPRQSGTPGRGRMERFTAWLQAGLRASLDA